MWNFPRPGIKAVYSTLASRFLTTGNQRSHLSSLLKFLIINIRLIPSLIGSLFPLLYLMSLGCLRSFLQAFMLRMTVNQMCLIFFFFFNLLLFPLKPPLCSISTPLFWIKLQYLPLQYNSVPLFSPYPISCQLSLVERP